MGPVFNNNGSLLYKVAVLYYHREEPVRRSRPTIENSVKLGKPVITPRWLMKLNKRVSNVGPVFNNNGPLWNEMVLFHYHR